MKFKINSTLKTIIVITIAIAILLISWYFSPPSPKVTTTLPKDNQRHVLNTTDITVTFNRLLSNQDQRLLRFSLTPTTAGSISFKDNTLSFKPNILEKNQLYEASITYHDIIIHRFSFETNLYSTTEIKLQGQQQIKDDYLFNQKVNQALEKYPWYPQLPIKTSEYRIYYDFDLDLFRIRLLAPGLNKKDLDMLIKKALTELTEIGVPKPIKYKLLTTP